MLPEEGELLLVVDQLEEVFTLVEDPKQSDYFLQSLYEAVARPAQPGASDDHLAGGFLRPPVDAPGFQQAG